MPSLGINWPESLKKVTLLRDTRSAHSREKQGDAGLLNWQLGSAYWERKRASHHAFTNDVIPCYRKRGAGEPIFALRKVSLDILFSDVRFNRATRSPAVSEWASERTSEVQRPLGRTLLVFSLSESPSSRFTVRFRHWNEREVRRDLLSIVVSLLLADTARLHSIRQRPGRAITLAVRDEISVSQVSIVAFSTRFLYDYHVNHEAIPTQCVTTDPKPTNFRRGLRWPRVDVTATCWYFRFTGNLARLLRNDQRWSRRQCKINYIIGSSHVAKDDSACWLHAWSSWLTMAL